MVPLVLPFRVNGMTGDPQKNSAAVPFDGSEWETFWEQMGRELYVESHWVSREQVQNLAPFASPWAFASFQHKLG